MHGTTTNGTYCWSEKRPCTWVVESIPMVRAINFKCSNDKRAYRTACTIQALSVRAASEFYFFYVLSTCTREAKQKTEIMDIENRRHAKKECEVATMRKWYQNQSIYIHEWNFAHTALPAFDKPENGRRTVIEEKTKAFIVQRMPAIFSVIIIQCIYSLYEKKRAISKNAISFAFGPATINGCGSRVKCLWNR